MPFIKQSLSWTDLNDKSKFALFLQQGQLNTSEASLSEVILRFVCFVNLYLLRMRQIGNSVDKISNLMKEFYSLRSTAVSCPERINENQSRFLTKDIMQIYDLIETEANHLFALQMDTKFISIIPFFATTRPNMCLMDLVESYGDSPSYYASFINMRLGNFLLSFQNESVAILNKLKSEKMIGVKFKFQI